MKILKKKIIIHKHDSEQKSSRFNTSLTTYKRFWKENNHHFSFERTYYISHIYLFYTEISQLKHFWTLKTQFPTKNVGLTRKGCHPSKKGDKREKKHNLVNLYYLSHMQVLEFKYKAFFSWGCFLFFSLCTSQHLGKKSKHSLCLLLLLWGYVLVLAMVLLYLLEV